MLFVLCNIIQGTGCCIGEGEKIVIPEDVHRCPKDSQVDLQRVSEDYTALSTSSAALTFGPRMGLPAHSQRGSCLCSKIFVNSVKCSKANSTLLLRMSVRLVEYPIRPQVPLEFGRFFRRLLPDFHTHRHLQSFYFSLILFFDFFYLQESEPDGLLLLSGDAEKVKFLRF
jgi:hypothetical protein